jgi:hypothetical protein
MGATAEGRRSGAQVAPSCPPVARLGASLALFPLLDGDGEAPQNELPPAVRGMTAGGYDSGSLKMHLA